jgi:hypothetical protein
VAYIRDRDRIRTCDRLLRRQMLYPAELRDRGVKSNLLTGGKSKLILSIAEKKIKLTERFVISVSGFTFVALIAKD